MTAGDLQLTVGLRNYSAKPVGDWRHLLDQARAADDAGVDRVFLSDHVVFGSDLSAYGESASGGRAGGKQPTGPDGDWMEALTTIAAMAAVTSRVRLTTNVLVAPLRPAVLLAKVAATIDSLSAGRFELGVGIGWQQAEYRALGVDFTARGRLLDEQLEVCRLLWTQDEVDFVGRGFSLEGVHMMPKPMRPAGVPVWIGGRAIPVAARRLARYGAGWIPWGTSPADFIEVVDRMRTLLEQEGRDPASVQVAYPLVTTPAAGGGLDLERMLADVPRLREHGITDFRTLVRVPQGYEQALDFLNSLVAEFRSAAT